MKFLSALITLTGVAMMLDANWKLVVGYALCRIGWEFFKVSLDEDDVKKPEID